MENGDDEMQERLSRALGVSKAELGRLVEAGRAVSEAIASENVDAVAEAERSLRSLYTSVRSSVTRSYFQGSFSASYGALALSRTDFQDMAM